MIGATEIENTGTRLLPITSLLPASYNPRRISDASLRGLEASIRRWGLVEPIVWNKQTGRVVGGHQRLKAMAAIGVGEVEVKVVDLDETEERALNVSLNNPAIQGEFTPSLQELLVEIGDGMGASAMQELCLADLMPSLVPDVVEVATPEPPSNPITKPGDLWILGEHRLLCGDATRIEDVRRVASAPAAMCFTDPPYDIDYRGCARDAIEGTQRRPIANDALGDEYDAFLSRVIENVLASTAGASYTCIGHQRAHTLRDVWLRAGGHLSTFIVWAKSHFVLGGGDYNPRFELLIYGWREGGAHPWYGPENETNVWEIDKPAANPLHPTQKPLELVARAITNSSHSGESVLDVCAGSGSTLLAAEQIGRRALLIELDPAYCDVIVQRYESLTGKTASRVAA